MIEDIYNFKSHGASKSTYTPSSDVIDATKIVKRDYSYGHGLLTRPWIELNDRSVIEDENRGQLMFNAFVDTSSEDPAEAWKWRGTRSRARNKGIAMHANLTGNFIMPSYTAQNDEDDIDLEFSEMMRDIVEWMCSPNNSNYQPSFLQVTMGMMTNPVTYLGAEYYEVFQTIKDKQADGSVSKKEILDEVLSGFNAPVWSSSQVLISNPYERNMQRQRSIIKRRWKDMSELEARFGDHPNWIHVKAGWQTVYNEEDGLFYRIRDLQHPNLVEEVVWECRKDDTELTFLGGIYFGEDNVDDNPIQHRDSQGAPKYNVVPFGYSRIGEHFFYYKSMMNILQWDNGMYDAMTEMVMNRTMLEVDMPLAITGSDKVDSEIVFPKAIVAFEDPEAKITPLLPKSNLSAGFAALADIDKAMSDESIDAVSSGQMPAGRQMAYVLATVQAQAKKMIGEIAKQMNISMMSYGDLMKDIAVNHVTTPEVEELTSGQLRLKYKSFLLENKQVGGRTMHKHIIFDQSLIGAQLTDEDKDKAALALLEESGWPDNSKAIVRANPEMISRFKYLTRYDTEEMFKKNDEFWQPILTNLYQITKDDPYIDQEGIRRRLMRSYFKSEGDSLVVKPKNNPMAGAPQGTAPQGAPGGGLGPMAQNKALSTTMAPGMQ